MTDEKSKQKSKNLTLEMECKTVTESKTMKKDQESPEILYNKRNSNTICPSCKGSGENFIVEGRCITCTECGWSKCAW